MAAPVLVRQDYHDFSENSIPRSNVVYTFCAMRNKVTPSGKVEMTPVCAEMVVGFSSAIPSVPTITQYSANSLVCAFDTHHTVCPKPPVQTSGQADPIVSSSYKTFCQDNPFHCADIEKWFVANAASAIGSP